LWQKYFQDLSNPDFKQDFDYEKYDLSHIQNAIIEKNEKGKLKIEPIRHPNDSEIIWYQRMTLS
jgi:hypothetical protein